jgi:hypothetical protein
LTIFLHLLRTVVRTLVTEHDVESLLIAGVHQDVEDELVRLGDVSVLASVRFTALVAGGRPAIAQKTTAQKLIKNFVNDTHDRPLARYIFPVKGPPVILMKLMVAWILSILLKRARC